MPEEQMLETFSGSMNLSADMVMACVERLKELYEVDGVYLLGFSQGGIVTYITGMRHPDAFSGIATFSGILDQEAASDQMLESACGLPVFLGRGTQENDRAILARDRLLNAGFEVTFHEYEGGHYFPDSSLRAFEDWMMEQ
jgi:phospholipase/carboxylesterase